MPNPVQTPPHLSVHIMLPEAVDRRLERWTNKLAGASWPAWGGHVTLVPPFVNRGEPGAARAALQTVCAREEPFHVRFGAPIALPDATRPDYFAVFLTVDSTDADIVRGEERPRDDADPAAADESSDNERTPVKDVDAADKPPSNLHLLRQRLLTALQPLREDVYPKLLEQKFLPHVTLALGLGEVEANKLVREIRAEPLIVAFKVEVVWLVTQTFGDGARFERDPIPLGRVAPAELMRD